MNPTPRPVTEIQIGGHAYRVQSSADASELSRLAQLVEARLTELPGNQRHDARSLVLVALSLAHDLEQLRVEYAALRASVDERLTAIVGRIDRALDHRDEKGDLLPPLPEPATTRADDFASRAESENPGESTSPADPATIPRGRRAHPTSNGTSGER